MKNYLICLVVSLILALLMPLVVMDMYEPVNYGASADQMVVTGGQEVQVHDAREAGLGAKIKFYFSSFTTLKYYFENVMPWLLAMFLSAAVSTYFIQRLQKP